MLLRLVSASEDIHLPVYRVPAWQQSWGWNFRLDLLYAFIYFKLGFFDQGCSSLLGLLPFFQPIDSTLVVDGCSIERPPYPQSATSAFDIWTLCKSAPCSSNNKTNFIKFCHGLLVIASPKCILPYIYFCPGML